MPVTKNVKILKYNIRRIESECSYYCVLWTVVWTLNHLECMNTELTASLQLTQKEVHDQKKENKHQQEEISQVNNNRCFVKKEVMEERMDKLSGRIHYQDSRLLSTK